jgi:hypothetical protein
MAVSFEVASQGTQASADPWTIGYPASGINSGDIILFYAHVDGDIAAAATPTDYTLIFNGSQGASDQGLDAYWKLADGSENAGNFSYDLASAALGTWGVSVYRGVDNTTPIHTSNVGPTGNGTSHATPNITTTIETALVGIWSVDESVDISFTTPGSMTPRCTPNDTTNDVTSLLSDEFAVAAGTLSRTATTSVSDPCIAGMIALTPAAVTTSLWLPPREAKVANMLDFDPWSGTGWR